MERQYVHITGFSRSGTTLLSNLFRCYGDVFVTPVEEARIQMAPRLKYRARTTVTRLPKDALDPSTMSRLIDKRDTLVVYMIRDPRDWLTSINRLSRGDDPNLEPHYDPVHLVAKIELLPCFKEHVDIVKYEELVRYPNVVQAHFVNQLSLEIECAFTEGYLRFPPESEIKEQKAMGPIRPPDTLGIGRWKGVRYRDKVEQVLEENPKLVEFINEYGY